jgi:hypothetical protein
MSATRTFRKLLVVSGSGAASVTVGLSSVYPWPVVAFCSPCADQAGAGCRLAWSVQSDTPMSAGSRECCGSGGPRVGQNVDPPVIFREPDPLFTGDGGHRNPGASGSVNRPLPLPRPERSAQIRHQAGSMIADAVRYMSVHSWKQPDSQGHSGTSQPRKQQPARPGIPSSRAVSAGSGRYWVRTNVG